MEGLFLFAARASQHGTSVEVELLTEDLPSSGVEKDCKLSAIVADEPVGHLELFSQFIASLRYGTPAHSMLHTSFLGRLCAILYF